MSICMKYALAAYALTVTYFFYVIYRAATGERVLRDSTRSRIWHALNLPFIYGDTQKNLATVLSTNKNFNEEMYPDDIYPWYSRNIMPVYYRDGYLRKGLMSVNSTRARMRNMMNYSSYRLPALGLSPETRYNLYKKRARIYP